MEQHTYMFVRWKHMCPDDPVEIWMELDQKRWEVRKVEVWPDGRVGYADSDEEAGGTGLSIEVLPELGDIAADPQFEPQVIKRDVFEAVWLRRQACGL